MKKLHDFACHACGHLFEAFANLEDAVACPQCTEGPAERRVTGGRLFTVIQATTNTSKRYKAGYVHNYQNRPAEKISVQVPASPKAP